MKNWSKVLSLFIVFAMVMSFPIAGFAEDDDMDDEWEAEERMIDDDEEDEENQKDMIKKMEKQKVKTMSRDAILKMALEMVDGEIMEFEFDDDDEEPEYEIKIKKDGRIHEMEFNAITGLLIDMDIEDFDESIFESTEEEAEEEDDDDDDDDDDDKDAPAWGHIKNDLQLQRKVLKEKMKSLREQMEILEESIEDAEEIDDLETLGQLNEHVKNFQAELEMQKLMSKQMIKDMQQLMKNKYSAEEWQALEKNKDDMKDMPGVRVMPAESILMPEGNLKFDVPPVIKNSRMLVPIRAISEALDADVSWDNDTRTATIITDEHTIVIAVSDETILVNGEPIETDVPAEIIRGRIVVPLRFIIENMGLDIEWDQETETAEILS